MPMPPIPTKWMGPISRGSLMVGSLGRHRPRRRTFRIPRRSTIQISRMQDVDGRDMSAAHDKGNFTGRRSPEIPATFTTRSASRSAASSRPTVRAAAAIAASRAGSAASAEISAASRSGVNSACANPQARRSPAPARRHWRTGPGRSQPGSGTRIEGRPMAASSATVPAPDRETTRWLRCQPRRQIGEERRQFGVDLEPVIDRAHPRHVLFAHLLGEDQPVPQRGLQPLDRAGHDIGHHARALAAADHEQAERPARFGRRVFHRGGREDRRPHRRADGGGLSRQLPDRDRARRAARSRSR